MWPRAPAALPCCVLGESCLRGPGLLRAAQASRVGERLIRKLQPLDNSFLSYAFQIYHPVPKHCSPQHVICLSML